MNFQLNDYDFKTQKDIFLFFAQAIVYRSSHKKESEKIARFVFDVTHNSRLGALYTDGIDVIRNEFGALEAPGAPDNSIRPDQYVDYLWDRLRLIVEEKS